MRLADKLRAEMKNYTHTEEKFEIFKKKVEENFTRGRSKLTLYIGEFDSWDDTYIEDFDQGNGWLSVGEKYKSMVIKWLEDEGFVLSYGSIGQLTVKLY